MEPDAIATAITNGLASFVERNRRTPLPHAHVYASAARECTRRMVYELTVPDQQAPLPVDVLARFRRGDDRERDLLADLSRVGRDTEPPFTVIGQQERFELRDRKGRVAIAGKVDARLRCGDFAAPVEIKAWSPFLVDRLRSFDDVFDNPWTRSGGFQLLSYLFGAGEPYGFLVLDRSGLPLVLPVTLEHHLDRMEAFLARAEVALDHVAAGTLPPFLVGDAAECQRCPFYGGTCNPPLVHDGAQVLTDPDLEALLEKRQELRAAGEEYERLDREVKARLRGVERGITTNGFAIEGRWGKQSRVELPADLKARYTTVDPHGRFTLTITRVQ